MKIKIFCFIFLSISPLLAGEITYTYLIYVSSFPNVAKKVDIPKSGLLDGYTNLKEKGYTVNDIPLKRTRSLSYPNTNYILIKVTPKNKSEKTLFDNEIAEGRVRLLSTSEYISEYNGRTGGVETKINRTFYEKPPDDAEINWTTYVSSP